MPASRDIIAKKHEAIRKEYKELWAQKKYKSVYIIEILSKKYFLSERTVAHIVYTKD